MSQTAVLPGSPSFTSFKSIVLGAASLVRGDAIPLLDELLREQVAAEFARLVSQPEWLRGELERSGDVTTIRLLKKNWDSIGGTAQVCDRTGVPRSTLHREKDAGRVIAYRPTADTDFVYPFEQFGRSGVLPFASEIIAAVGNGAPAIHFLYVPRESLGGESFAQTLREPRDRDVPALITKAVRRLAAE